MNENLKKVLIVIGVLVIYHYFFRSMAPTKPVATDTRPDTIADDIANGIDTISGQIVDPIIGVITSRTPESKAPKRSAQGSDQSFAIAAPSSVNVLQG